MRIEFLDLPDGRRIEVRLDSNMPKGIRGYPLGVDRQQVVSMHPDELPKLREEVSARAGSPPEHVTTFPEQFRRLPLDEQDSILELLAHALAWRGQATGLAAVNTMVAVRQIGEVFRRNGMEQAEHT
jgi:hypothetical protein